MYNQSKIMEEVKVKSSYKMTYFFFFLQTLITISKSNYFIQVAEVIQSKSILIQDIFKNNN